MAKIQPLGKRLLVRRSKAKTSKGGILLPDSAQEKPKEGEVLAVGPGQQQEDGQIETVSIQPGQKVLFSSYAGTEVKQESEEELLILNEDDILGILEETV